MKESPSAEKEVETHALRLREIARLRVIVGYQGKRAITGSAKIASNAPNMVHNHQKWIPLISLVYSSNRISQRATLIRYKIKELIAQKSFVEDRRVTLDEVAKVTGISRNTLSRIANTRGYSTTTDIIDKLCDYFCCELSELMERVVLDNERKTN